MPRLVGGIDQQDKPADPTVHEIVAKVISRFIIRHIFFDD